MHEVGILVERGAYIEGNGWCRIDHNADHHPEGVGGTGLGQSHHGRRTNVPGGRCEWEVGVGGGSGRCEWEVGVGGFSR